MSRYPVTYDLFFPYFFCCWHEYDRTTGTSKSHPIPPDRAITENWTERRTEHRWTLLASRRCKSEAEPWQVRSAPSTELLSFFVPITTRLLPLYLKHATLSGNRDYYLIFRSQSPGKSKRLFFFAIAHFRSQSRSFKIRKKLLSDETKNQIEICILLLSLFYFILFYSFSIVGRNWIFRTLANYRKLLDHF